MTCNTCNKSDLDNFILMINEPDDSLRMHYLKYSSTDKNSKELVKVHKRPTGGIWDQYSNYYGNTETFKKGTGVFWYDAGDLSILYEYNVFCNSCKIDS